MTNEDFIKQYQTKKWYEISKRIKARDHNTCQMCGRNDRPLNVHHRYYGENGNILKVPDNALVTLCEECHKSETKSRRELHNTLDEIKRRFDNYGFSIQLLESILWQILNFFDRYEYGESEKEDFEKGILIDALYGSQILSDIYAAQKMGFDCRELLRFAYPQFAKNNKDTQKD